MHETTMILGLHIMCTRIELLYCANLCRVDHDQEVVKNIIHCLEIALEGKDWEMIRKTEALVSGLPCSKGLQ